MIDQFERTAVWPSIGLEPETPHPAKSFYPRRLPLLERAKPGECARGDEASPSEVLDMAAFFVYQSKIASAQRELTRG